MHASLRQLETLKVFSMTRSITETARLTRVSQPAVSQTLKELELQFGFAIYTRAGSRIALTAEVMQILPDVERLLTNFSALQGRVSELRDLRAGSVSIIAGPTQSQDLLPRAVWSFRQQRPNVRIHLEVSADLDMARKVKDEIYDLGIGFFPSLERGVASQPLIETQLVCVVGKHHPLAEHPVIDPRRLVGQTVVVVHHDMGSTLRMQQLLHGTLGAENLITTNQSTVAINIVRMGEAVAVLHPLAIPKLALDQLHIARFEPMTEVAFALYYSRRRPLSRISAKFMLAVRDSAKVHGEIFRSRGIPFVVPM